MPNAASRPATQLSKLEASAGSEAVRELASGPTMASMMPKSSSACATGAVPAGSSPPLKTPQHSTTPPPPGGSGPWRDGIGDSALCRDQPWPCLQCLGLSGPEKLSGFLKLIHISWIRNKSRKLLQGNYRQIFQYVRDDCAHAARPGRNAQKPPAGCAQDYLNRTK